ncbi:MAG: IS66 family insertion sequence element accessory protein TnpB [Sphaerochaeta sp.]|nr:IS66 family insertion sequence element accessory protein TnpB [Sphaerochaeta sp.]
MSLPFDTSLEGKKIFLRVGATDFRRGIRGMVSLVVGAMNLKMDEQSIFVFCSTNRKQVRIVYCEGAGCWMLARSVRYGRYSWPMDSKAAAQMTANELRGLLDDPIPLEHLKARGLVSRMDLHI